MSYENVTKKQLELELDITRKQLIEAKEALEAANAGTKVMLDDAAKKVAALEKDYHELEAKYGNVTNEIFNLRDENFKLKDEVSSLLKVIERLSIALVK